MEASTTSVAVKSPEQMLSRMRAAESCERSMVT
jgi:hypothetical protein